VGDHEVAREVWRQDPRSADAACAHPRNGLAPPRILRRLGLSRSIDGGKNPAGARIIAVADAYDTITSDRTYKKARTATDALAELERCANAQFDGAIVELFVRTMRAMPNPIIEVAATTGPVRTS